MISLRRQIDCRPCESSPKCGQSQEGNCGERAPIIANIPEDKGCLSSVWQRGIDGGSSILLCVNLNIQLSSTAWEFRL